MTKEELVKKLKKVAKELELSVYDEEAAHIRADDLLIEYINNEEIREAYDAIQKWYA